jgi:molecular chaperone GrpE
MTPKSKKHSETPSKKDDKQEKVEEPEVKQPPTQASEAGVTLDATIAEVKAEAEEYKSKLAYMQAEHENYVKSVKKLESQLRLHANRDLILRLLPILDDLERAQIMVPHIEENAPFIEGLHMIVENLKVAFSDTGVTPIVCEGQPFDPLRHEAVVRDETREHAPNTVLKELRRGYLLKGELLRPAMVKIAIAPKIAPKEKKVPPIQPEKSAKKM